MKKNEIQVGGVYIAKVSGREVPVRVNSIDGFTLRGKETVRYEVTNTVTGRKTTFKSAAKFRRPHTADSAPSNKIFSPGPKAISDLFKF